MAEATTQATADGATHEEKPAATPAGTGATEKQAETVTADAGSEDDKPVTHKDLRRVLRSKDHWKERALRLEGENQVLRGGKRDEPSKRDEEPQPPKRESFQTWEEYWDAKTAFNAERAAEKRFTALEKARDEKAAKAKAEETDGTLTKAWTASVEKTREKYDDYDEKVQAESFNPTPQMARAMLESDHKAEIAYYLASNPEEMERIAKLSPARQMAETLKLEEKIQAKAPAKKPSKAPAPIDPVGGKAGTDDGLRDDLPIAEWTRRRQRQLYGK